MTISIPILYTFYIIFLCTFIQRTYNLRSVNVLCLVLGGISTFPYVFRTSSNVLKIIIFLEIEIN